jgi:hypothetical protein
MGIGRGRGAYVGVGVSKGGHERAILKASATGEARLQARLVAGQHLAFGIMFWALTLLVLELSAPLSLALVAVFQALSLLAFLLLGPLLPPTGRNPKPRIVLSGRSRRPH